MIYVVGGPATRGRGWVTWLVADLGERALWVETAERAALFARTGADPPTLIVATEADLLELQGAPLLAEVPRVLVDGSVERARALGCVGIVPPGVGREMLTAGIARVLERIRWGGRDHPPQPG
jgi:hypothetical protein